MRRIRPAFHARLKKLLRDNKRAMQYLAGRGITGDAVEYFGLGLSTPYYSKKSKHEQADALAYPLRGPDGEFYNKYCFYNIPGVTRNPSHNGGWTSGEARTYYGGRGAGKKVVFVCQQAIDLWRHWLALDGTALGDELLLICSTQETAIPEEWKVSSFWAGWETIFLGHDNDEAGEHLAAQLAELVGRDARRVFVPLRYGKDWTAFWQGGADGREFTELRRA